MATGIDTSLLVAAEVTSHLDHSRARGKLQSVTQDRFPFLQAACHFS